MKLIAERKLDELGRIVLPLEVRSANGWLTKTPLSIFMEEDGSVVLRAPQRRCCLCGRIEDLQPIKQTWMCPSCLAELQSSGKSTEEYALL